ncbi:pyridoxal phosphate-dependent decarboxylase family protein [Agromyces aerolatus]|uniref:pyridoxal phosphate-dependent decarboxylase family protein n=1 Tax=Agromyces sp. LY-1074 TaxID=3074080 RepID=UPI002862A52C|nr:MULTISPECIES: pyridoxal-dependent decarboxylase [unclassified Agromyces]MDR5701004.1 pyridoxal-dependent decarboxylase [Agromyces sp. LY-1074]MDR5707644.1 pyridoxal-dependent decarboxylase [Agromyces sp. LY-1358]
MLEQPRTRSTRLGAGDRPDRYDEVLSSAAGRAKAWLDTVRERPIPPRATVDEVTQALGRELPDEGAPAIDTIERLADAVEPGLLAIGSPRFYGWVMGGTQPAGLAADWLVSAWDQNSGMRNATPGTVAAEELAGAWLLQLLGLPAESAVGFVTGATMAQFSAMAAGRDEVLRRAGWDVAVDGLAGGPKVRLVVGAERHGTVDLAARYLGLGAPIEVAADREGRILVDALAETLAAGEGPALVVLQAGNIHSGAFDAFGPAVEVAHRAGAWVHVDGAFGLWAAASPRFASLVDGLETADSWSTDAHKTLNVPYDCGISIVRDEAAMRRALSMHASYLMAPGVGADPHEKAPELSRRARGVPTWAVLRTLGRRGVGELVERLAGSARTIADGLAAIPGVEVLNEVVFTQVSIALEDDAATTGLSERLWRGGEVLAMTSRWHDRAIVRFSVSNWQTDASEARRTVALVARAIEELRAGR